MKKNTVTYGGGIIFTMLLIGLFSLIVTINQKQFIFFPIIILTAAAFLLCQNLLKRNEYRYLQKHGKKIQANIEEVFTTSLELLNSPLSKKVNTAGYTPTGNMTINCVIASYIDPRNQKEKYTLSRSFRYAPACKKGDAVDVLIHPSDEQKDWVCVEDLPINRSKLLKFIP